jgi:hypothetical protein
MRLFRRQQTDTKHCRKLNLLPAPHRRFLRQHPRGKPKSPYGPGFIGGALSPSRQLHSLGRFFWLPYIDGPPGRSGRVHWQLLRCSQRLPSMTRETRLPRSRSLTTGNTSLTATAQDCIPVTCAHRSFCLLACRLGCNPSA